MATQTWTDPTLSDSINVKDTHFEELMEAINDWEYAYGITESHYTQAISQIDENVKFTSFVENDPSSKLTISQYSIVFTNLQLNQQAYVYKNYGISGPWDREYFSRSFTQLVDVNISSTETIQYLSIWMMSNVEQDLAYHRQYEKYLAVNIVRFGGKLYISLEEGVGGSYNTDDYEISTGNTYYLKIKRDETVGTYGTLYCYIYSDSDRTVLLDTLQLSLSSFENFKNLYGINSYGSGTSTYKISGTVSNLQIPKKFVNDISVDEMQDALDTLKTLVDGDTFSWNTADPGDIITGGDPTDFVDQLRTNMEYFQDDNCYLCHTCDTYTACSCDLTCHGYISCSCDLTCYNEGCSCNAKCYGYHACSCNSACYLESKSGCNCYNTCYSYSPCSCYNTCYGQSCSCNSSCYGYISCSCNSSCYGYACSKCDITDYEYPWS